MRNRKEIEKETNPYNKIKLEVQLDIRDLLIKLVENKTMTRRL